MPASNSDTRATTIAGLINTTGVDNLIAVQIHFGVKEQRVI